MTERLAQIVVEVTGGDVYINHNLGDEVMVTLYDYDLAEREDIEAANALSTQAEVTVGQSSVDESHKEWGRYVREREESYREVYDCSKDYWNDHPPDEVWAD